MVKRQYEINAFERSETAFIVEKKLFHLGHKIKHSYYNYFNTLIL
jgi:hypothetical protein